MARPHTPVPISSFLPLPRGSVSSDLAPRRWTDDRLDDLAKVVYHNDGRLDTVHSMASQTHNDLEAIKRAAADHTRSRFEQAAIAAALLSPVATLILGLVYHH